MNLHPKVVAGAGFGGGLGSPIAILLVWALRSFAGPSFDPKHFGDQEVQALTAIVILVVGAVAAWFARGPEGRLDGKMETAAPDPAAAEKEI